MRSSVPTRLKLEFVYLMAKHSNATLADCQRLMHLGASLGRLAEDHCNFDCEKSHGLKDEECPKQKRLEQKVMDICYAITPICRPRFQHDPRGNTVKIVVPDGHTNDLGREGICVPTS
jgi:hypothetical protein